MKGSDSSLDLRISICIGKCHLFLGNVFKVFSVVVYGIKMLHNSIIGSILDQFVFGEHFATLHQFCRTLLLLNYPEISCLIQSISYSISVGADLQCGPICVSTEINIFIKKNLLYSCHLFM